jgi:hypothetical protein
MYLNDWQFPGVDYELRVKTIEAKYRHLTGANDPRLQQRKPAWLESLRRIVQPSQE